MHEHATSSISLPVVVKSRAGTIIGYRSGVRSAILSSASFQPLSFEDGDTLQLPKMYFRYKGCGNNYDLFPLALQSLKPVEMSLVDFRRLKGREKDLLGKDIPSYPTIRGSLFPSTAQRELKMTHLIDVRCHRSIY